MQAPDRSFGQVRFVLLSFTETYRSIKILVKSDLLISYNTDIKRREAINAGRESKPQTE
jgi:hypothetical protein